MGASSPMLARYVIADLVRNPRRSLSTTIGVVLGIGLFCAVMFFVDGLSSSMTQRAVAPLPIDMQRVVTAPLAADLELRLTVQPLGAAQPGDVIEVTLEVINNAPTPTNEVTVRSTLGQSLAYVPGSAMMDNRSLGAGAESPFARGPAKTGLNIGTVPPGTTTRLFYRAGVLQAGEITEASFASTFSTREAILPIRANAGQPIRIDELAFLIRQIDGIAFAEQLSFADLAPGSLSAGSTLATPARVFGFDAGYLANDRTIRIVEGMQVPGEAMISAEAAEALGLAVGDLVSLELPDATAMRLAVSGIVDLTQARSLFSSRRGSDLETFIYIPNSVIVGSSQFAEIVVPAFERAATSRGDRLKAPPVREVDIGVERELLDAEPSIALDQTQRIAAVVNGVAPGQDFLIDNISNTLAVARNDATTAKQMFAFLGVPGAMLAAMIAAYAGIVLGSTERRERATLRMRGASRRHLLMMLAFRVSCIIGTGAVAAVVLGYISAAMVIGHQSLTRASLASLALSGALGAIVGLMATGGALYVTGTRSIENEINQDRSRLWTRPHLWKRYYLDLVGILAVLLATAAVFALSGFEGIPGSVYQGQAVEIPLYLLNLPLGVWIAGCFFAGRIFSLILSRSPGASGRLDRPLALLYTSSLRRRSGALVEVAIILGLIVALATCMAVFTASYDGAKAADARYVVGADFRITPSPAAARAYLSDDAGSLHVPGVAAVTPVIYGVRNVILNSLRTSDPANLAALEPVAYGQITRPDDDHFSNGDAAQVLAELSRRPRGILVDREMAAFLRIVPGDTLDVLLARNTPQRVMVGMEVIGLFERLPGFPDGAQALMNLDLYEQMVPSARPAFFLAETEESSTTALAEAVAEFNRGPAAGGHLQVDTRLTALAQDQSSLAALNIGGLIRLVSAFALAMGTVTIAIFVFALMLQRRREYVTLRALGMPPRAIRSLIAAEAATAAVAGCAIGVPVGLIMAYYLVNVLRPLFILDPPYLVPHASLGLVAASILTATAVTAMAASSLVNHMRATELLRDE